MNINSGKLVGGLKKQTSTSGYLKSRLSAQRAATKKPLTIKALDRSALKLGKKNRVKFSGKLGDMSARKVQSAAVAEQRLRFSALSDISKQGWFKSIKSRDRAGIYQEFSKLSTSNLQFWRKNGQMVKGNFYYTTKGAYYSHKKGKVFLNILGQDDRTKFIGGRYNMRCFFHETGHLFDHLIANAGKASGKASLNSQIANFKALLQARSLGVANYQVSRYALYYKHIPSIAAWKNFSRITDMPKEYQSIVSRFMKGEHLPGIDANLRQAAFSCASDIMEGCFDGALIGGYGHERAFPGYWSADPNALCSEAWAEFFEARMIGGKWEDMIKSVYAPEYAMFISLLEQLL